MSETTNWQGAFITGAFRNPETTYEKYIKQDHLRFGKPQQPFKSLKPFKILTSDLLIVDRIINYDLLEEDQKKAIDQLMSSNGMKMEKKYRFADKEKFNEFSSVIKDKKIATTDTPGGSSANTATTLQKMMQDMVQTIFIGIVSNHYDNLGKLIRKDLRDSRVFLDSPSGDNHESATSFVVIKGGQRSIITWPGNARAVFGNEALHNELLQENKVSDADAILLQGSLPYKFGETIPVPFGEASDDKLGVTDWLLKQRWRHGKDLYFTMPTQADFAVKYNENGNEIPLTEEERKERRKEKIAYYQRVASEANLILGNGEEISRVYTRDDEYNEIFAALEKGGARQEQESDEKYQNRIEELSETKNTYDFVNKSVKINIALERLKKVVDDNALAKDLGERTFKGNKEQAAFVTLGEAGAAIITKDHGIEHVSSTNQEVVNTLGAGDTSYAGFIAGYVLKKQNPDITFKDCADLAMWLAGEKIKLNSPRIPDIQKLLQGKLYQQESSTNTTNNPADEFVKKIKTTFEKYNSMASTSSGHFF